jgi:hypothetical protein
VIGESNIAHPVSGGVSAVFLLGIGLIVFGELIEAFNSSGSAESAGIITTKPGRENRMSIPTVTTTKLGGYIPFLAFNATNIVQKFLPIVIIIMAVVFILGIIAIVSGATRIKNGDTDGVMGIVAGVIMAAAPIIMAAIYIAFGMQQAAIQFGQ